MHCHVILHRDSSVLVHEVDTAFVKLDTRQIADWDTFHDAFVKAFGFPDYGGNMNADCMTSLDDLSAGMSSVHVPKAGY